MECPGCQQPNAEDARFCEGCGAPLSLRCAGCGREVRAGVRFCAGCGRPAGREVTEKERPPRSYTPKHLADKILASKSALEGERKQVTVLFADVKG